MGDGGVADVALGREVFGDGGGDLMIGQPVEAGEDEGLQFGVGVDDRRAARAVGAAAFDRLTRELADTLRLTVFLITHDLDTLHATCDRIAVLAERKVLVTGTMQEMQNVDHPWVHEYFHGPRARAAQSSAAAPDRNGQE